MELVKSLRPSVRRSAFGLAAAAALVGGIWVLPACSAQTGATGNGDDAVLATIGDQAVTRAEVTEEAKEGLKQAELQKLQCESNYQRSLHEVMQQTLQTVVRDRLLDAEAASRGISRDDLLKAEVDEKLTEVTESEIDKFYTENQAQIRQPKQQVAEQIQQYLARQKRDEAYNGFITSLEEKAKVDYKLGPYRVEVATNGPAKGKESAPVTIVEFSDFQCPYCSRVVPTLKQVEEKYGDKVRVVFRHFPLNFHQQAQKAAEASLCANEQGKFWEMHDLLFAEQQSLQVADLKDKASRLSLNTETFNSCLDSGKYFDAIQDDLQAGVVAGVSGTPALFINGRFLSGAQPYASFKRVVDEALGSEG